MTAIPHLHEVVALTDVTFFEDPDLIFANNPEVALVIEERRTQVITKNGVAIGYLPLDYAEDARNGYRGAIVSWSGGGAPEVRIRIERS